MCLIYKIKFSVVTELSKVRYYSKEVMSLNSYTILAWKCYLSCSLGLKQNVGLGTSQNPAIKFNLPVQLREEEYITFEKSWEFGKKILSYF